MDIKVQSLSIDETHIIPRINSSSPLQITQILPIESFQIPKYYEPYVESVILPHGTIQSRIHKIANEIAEYYQNRPFIILVVLKGAFVAFTDLFKALQEIYSTNNHSYSNLIMPEFVRLKSYSNEGSTGKIDAVGLDMIDFTDKEILIVEDIVDTGLTMSYLLNTINEKQPRSVKIFSLLLKEARTQFDFPIDFVGFIIPDKFVVGYGLDYNEYFRDLKHICVLNTHGRATYKAKVQCRKLLNIEAENP